MPNDASPDDADRSAPLAQSQAAGLRRMRLFAAALLLAAAVLWSWARWQGRGTEPWDAVAAFAEAALIGGLADWFAVVALFRRPLGLPIWHTAILPHRKDDVARNLGEFVEHHLVTPEALRAQLPQADLAGQLAQALQRPVAAQQVGAWLAELAPHLLDGLDDEALAAWLGERVRDTLSRVDGAALSYRMADGAVDAGLHQRLVDGLARGVADYLAEPDHLPALGDFLARAMNIDNPMIKGMVTAAAPKAAAGMVALLDDLQARPDHPWRLQVDAWVAQWLAQARGSKVWQARVHQWQTDLIASPALQTWLVGLWPGLKASLQSRLAQDPAALATHLGGSVQQLGRHLAGDDDLRRRLNTGLAEAAAALAAEHRGAAARFLTRQLARWSGQEMADKVELAIGRDLQFIRVNGTLVGGLIGLALHWVGRL